MKSSLGISNFPEEISSLSHSVIFLYFFAFITEEGFLTLLAILETRQSNGFIFPFLLCLSPPQTTILPFCISFSWGFSWSLPPVQCHKSPSIIFQALFLSDLIPWIYLPLPLYNRNGFDLGHTWMVEWFSICPWYLSLNLAMSSWSEPQSVPGLIFADCIELLHLWMQRI